MLDPELHYQVWKQEHGELMRRVARRRESKEALPYRLQKQRILRLGIGQRASTYGGRLALVAVRYLGVRFGWSWSR